MLRRPSLLVIALSLSFASFGCSSSPTPGSLADGGTTDTGGTPQISFDGLMNNVALPAMSAVVPLKLSQPASGAGVKVGVGLHGPSIVDSDYTLSGATVTNGVTVVFFPPGATTANITVQVVPNRASLQPVAIALMLQTVEEGDATIDYSHANYSLTFGASNSSASVVNFGSASQQMIYASTTDPTEINVSLWPAATADVQVFYTVSGTAVSGQDYTLTPASSLTIPAGQTSGHLSLQLMNQSMFTDAVKTVVILLTGVTGPAMPDPTNTVLTVSILNSVSLAVSLTQKEMQLVEGMGPYTLTFGIPQAQPKDILIQYLAYGDGLVQDTNFHFSGDGHSVTIPAGQTSAELQITVPDDMQPRCDGTLHINPSTADFAGATNPRGVAGNSANVTYTVKNSDPFPAGTNDTQIHVSFPSYLNVSTLVQDATTSTTLLVPQPISIVNYTLPGNSPDGTYQVGFQNADSGPDTISVEVTQTFCQHDSFMITVPSMGGTDWALNLDKMGDTITVHQ